MKTERTTPRGERRTIIDTLRSHVERRPSQLAFRFYRRLSDFHDLTYRELWLRAGALARHLSDRGLEGERVLLAVREGADFVIVFFACLMAGAVAVPAPPMSRKRLVERLRLMTSDAQAKAIVGDTDEVLAPLWGAGVETVDARTFCADDAGGARGSTEWHAPSPEATSLAFLQYTSGSTGDPKGVMVTHGNVIANCREITASMNLSERSKCLNVLPLYHDMGLVTGVLLPVFNGAVAHMLPTVRFVEHPEWWLQLISLHRITSSGAPNFMYDLVTNEVRDEQLQGVDLSSWEAAYCGAEPIRASTLARFVDRFEPHGFRPSSFCPCYGMAEATLFITGHQLGEPARVEPVGGSVASVGCGSPRLGTRVELVDPNSRFRVPDNVEGEVWVQGDSIAAGYWNRPSLTKEVFGAFIADSCDGPFLRTGDLGVRKDDQLHITGRLKDVIIVRGRKLAPQDIEHEVEQCHEAVQPAGCAAFGVEREGSEALVVVAELRRAWLARVGERQAILDAMGAAILSAFQVCAAEIVLVLPHSIPRTSSGKLRRAQTRADFIGGRLASVTDRDRRRARRGEYARSQGGLTGSAGEVVR